MTKEEFFKEHFNDEYEDVEGIKFMEDLESVIKTECLLPPKPIDNKKIKLGEIFEVEGKLYSIQMPKTGSESTNLNYGRNIYEFHFEE